MKWKTHVYYNQEKDPTIVLFIFWMYNQIQILKDIQNYDYSQVTNFSTWEFQEIN